MTIDESIVRFQHYISTERRMARRTVEKYSSLLAELSAHLRARQLTELDDLTARDLREWEMHHVDQGEAPATVKLRLAAVSSWLRFLRVQGLFDKDLRSQLQAPKQPHHLPVFFRQGELEHLYDEHLFAPDYDGQRDRLMLRLLYETGIRRAELVGMRERSVDLASRTIKVLGKRDKERIVPIEPELASTIANYLDLKRQTWGDSEWLFLGREGHRLSYSSVYNIVRRYMTRLSSADRISPHVFRHSFATHILDGGGDLRAIQELLGHENLQTTEIYTHITPEHLKHVYQQAHPRGKKSN